MAQKSTLIRPFIAPKGLFKGLKDSVLKRNIVAIQKITLGLIIIARRCSLGLYYVTSKKRGSINV